MSELLLINPRRARRMRRNPRRLSAKQAMYFGPRRGRVRRLRRNPTAVVAAPARPGRFRRARAYLASRRRRSSTGGSFNIESIMTGMLLPAGIGAAGALALDLAWGNLPIPDVLKTGAMAPVARIGGAVLIGVAVGMVAGKRNGAYAAVGAMTVTIADLAKTWAASSFPSISLGAYVGRGGQLGYYGAARQFAPGVGAYVSRRGY